MIILESKKLSELFFSELKHYNGTNFRALKEADLTESTPADIKAFSSTITRYFIFVEKHPEISDIELRMLYYQLKLDMVTRFFANYPAADVGELRPFQLELANYLAVSKSD